MIQLAPQQTTADKLRPFMMGLTSVVLCLSVLMSVFCAYPLALVGISYGRVKMLVSCIFATILCYFITTSLSGDSVFFSFFLANVFMAVGLAEIVQRKFVAMKGIFGLGVIILIGIVSVGASQVYKDSDSLTGYLEKELVAIKPFLDEQKKKIQSAGKAGTEGAEQLMGDPKLLANYLIKEVPSVFIIYTFITIWVNMFLLLKSRRLISADDNGYNERQLLDFKMPDFFIWIVIVFLLGILFGDKVAPWVYSVSLTGLKTLGVFYFFQGFSIYIELLDIIKLHGFFRSLLVVMTILTAGQVLAVVGLLDMFVNFKQLLRKKINRGE